MKRRIRSLFLALFLLLLARPVYALYDPRSVPNNQFGIHVVDPTDIQDVANLVNSSGGDWGYVKFVIPETDRNTDKWNAIFKDLRRKHLIPIVRIATKSQNGAWSIPTNESLQDWPRFLNSLSWPVENRYVVLFNEPNHAKEWGNVIDPEGFGSTFIKLAKMLKNTSGDFFILSPGLDVSAPNSVDTMDAEAYLRRLVSKNPEYLTLLDGWTSHSYPNPNFSQDPSKTGRVSLRSYVWELTLLYELGETRDLPVLIGETGWIHSDGESYTKSNLSPETVASYITTAGTSVWKDPEIFAVTPFIYNYQTPPFDHFSWKKIGGEGFYPHYFAYQDLKKTQGHPKQREFYKLLEPVLPSELVAKSQYILSFMLTNYGQIIISGKDGYVMQIAGGNEGWQFSSDYLQELEPGDSASIALAVRTPENAGVYDVGFALKHGDQVFDLAHESIKVVAPPSLSIHSQLGWRKTNTAEHVRVIVYDGTVVVQEFSDLTLDHGVITTPGILGIVPDRTYRIVTIVPYYLPRQSIIQIGRGVTVVPNRRFLPFDINNDHAFSTADIIAMFSKQPQTIISRFIGP